MKHWRVFTSRQAEEDTQEIYSYIAENNPQAAEAFAVAVEEAMSLLSNAPEIGSLRYFVHPDLTGLRFHPLRRFSNYLLFYRTFENEEALEIVRILHGARDLPTLFGTDEKPGSHNE
jgi:toxin ParE1/3/4